MKNDRRHGNIRMDASCTHWIGHCRSPAALTIYLYICPCICRYTCAGDIGSLKKRELFSTFNEAHKGTTLAIQNGKVKLYGVTTTVQWITGEHWDGRAKIVSLEPVANGVVRLDDQTEFVNPVDQPELGAYTYVDSYSELYAAPEVLKNSQVKWPGCLQCTCLECTQLCTCVHTY